MTKDAYLVHLPVFEGPLDLLLHLIEREKLDISTVSLGQVTDQFLAYIQAADRLQPGPLADFLAMAARLVWLKSRLLLPQPGRGDEDEEEDPGEALARQLREYKRFKQAAGAWQEILASGRRAFVRVAAPPNLERRLATGDATLAEFLAAVGSAFSARPPAPPVDSIVPPFTLTIQDQIHVILRAALPGRPVAFRSLLQTARSRLEVIVTLLALLELLKRRRVVVQQSELFGDIIISPAPDPAPGQAPGDENAEQGPDAEPGM